MNLAEPSIALSWQGDRFYDVLKFFIENQKTIPPRRRFKLEIELGSIFYQNLATLRQTSPAQADVIESAAPQLLGRLYPLREREEGFVDVEISTTGGGHHTIYGNAPPPQHLSEWVQQIALPSPPPHAILLLGMGTGDYPRRLLQDLPPNSKLALVEPDALLFMTAFVQLDLTDLLADSRTHFFVGQTPEKSVESIGAELEWPRFMNLSYRIMPTPLLKRCRPKFPQQFEARWRDALSREWMYRRSRESHSEEVVINTLANADPVRRYPGVSRLFQHFENTPAAIVAAGPSLNESLDDLAALQNNMMIACVNTAYPVLRKHGIEPNLVFVMDHQERNLSSFEGDTPSPHTYLVADPRVHPGIIEHFHPRVFMASWRTTTEPLGQPAPIHAVPVPRMSGNAVYLWLQEICGKKGDVYGPGSVAVVGFHILARMGCRPLILIGQDLAFTGDRHYAAGTIFDDQGRPRDANVSHLVQSVEGKPIPTSETLHLYRQLLEHEIKRFGVPVFNTGSGAAIAGTILTRVENVGKELEPLPVRLPTVFRMLNESYFPHADAQTLADRLKEAREQTLAFAQRALEGLRDTPSEIDESIPLEEKKRLKQDLDDTLRACTEHHPLTMRLLNELLQEAHFDRDDSRWRTLVMDDEEQRIAEQLRASIRVLDAFVTQGQQLASLLGGQIGELDSNSPFD